MIFTCLGTQELWHHRALHCEAVTVSGAEAATAAGRAVEASFRLSNLKWRAFSQYFRDNAGGVLDMEEVNRRAAEIPVGSVEEPDKGAHHVLVLPFSLVSSGSVPRLRFSSLFLSFPCCCVPPPCLSISLQLLSLDVLESS